MPTLLPATTIAAAVSAMAGPVLELRDGVPRSVVLQAKFAYGSGGTSVDAYVQSTLDGGTTWYDIVNFHFTTAAATAIVALSGLGGSKTFITPTNGSLASNTAIDGILGSRYRLLYQSAGTYAGATSIEVDIVAARLSSFP